MVEDPKEIEARNIMDMINKPSEVKSNLLDTVCPETWTNVGPTMVHAMTMVKASNAHLCNNVVHIQKLLAMFVQRTMHFMRVNDTEIQTMKNKVTRELQVQDRTTEQKLKTAMNQIKSDADKLEDKINAMMTDADVKMDEIDDKLSRVEDTSVIYEVVSSNLDLVKKDLQG